MPAAAGEDQAYYLVISGRRASRNENLLANAMRALAGVAIIVAARVMATVRRSGATMLRRA